MDSSFTPRTSQKADVRPISFVLDNMGSLGDPITLPVRPEDLTRSEPSRATVHQTMGRDTSGWVDHFGKGLATINISGTTGWRYIPALGRDGFDSFEALNELVVHRFPKFKQDAIDAGRDPAGVKLLFVDLLDNFTYPVIPLSFVLRRSKSRPLLFQYNISMQAISESIDAPMIARPETGTVVGGLTALSGVISEFDSIMDQVEGWIDSATNFIDGYVGPIALSVKSVTGTVNSVLKRINSVITAAGNVITSPVNKMIGIAADLASVGRNVAQTISGIANLPSTLKAQIGRLSAAFNEVVCIFKNSLSPDPLYEDYGDLFGASNCSSTTGGSAASPLLGQNVFELMTVSASENDIIVSTEAQEGIQAIKQSDPVLAPLLLPDMSRIMGSIAGGVRFNDV